MLLRTHHAVVSGGIHHRILNTSHHVKHRVLNQVGLVLLTHAIRNPLSLDVQKASAFAFVLQLIPFVNTAIRSKSGAFYLALANHIATGQILIETFNVEVISNVLNVKIKNLVPLRGLSSIV